MNQEISVLLIEDDPITKSELENCIDLTDNISLIKSTDNADDALSYTKDFLPAAIILDLELHLGGGNGITFLQELNKLNLGVSPYIVITTHNTSTHTHDCVRKLGADFIFSKHQSGYTAQSVVDFLIIMSDTILNKFKQNISQISTPESPTHKKQRLRKRIYAELNFVGINPKSLGYKYLVDAIEFLFEESEGHYSNVLGKKYMKTNSSVERAMQNAINRAWRTNDIEDLEKYYTARLSSYKGSPTLTEFIYYYSNKIKNEY